MRIVSVGRFNPTPAMLGTWMLKGESDEDRASIKHEAENVYGFVLDRGTNPKVEAIDIIFRPSEDLEQMAWQLTDLGAYVGFFIHEYRPGGSLEISGEEVAPPPLTQIDPELAKAYVPPSCSVSDEPLQPLFKWRCAKCQSYTFMLTELRGSSGGITAYMNWDTAVFTAVSCTHCNFTDFYYEPLESFRSRYNLKQQRVDDP